MFDQGFDREAEVSQRRGCRKLGGKAGYTVYSLQSDNMNYFYHKNISNTRIKMRPWEILKAHVVLSAGKGENYHNVDGQTEF